jgi:DNA recombination protein RmuC
MEGLLALATFCVGAVAGALATGLGFRALRRQERATHAEKLRVLERAELQLREAFQTLSAEALRQNNQSFLELARSSLGEYQKSAEHELEARQLAIEALVEPIRESLKLVDTKLHVVEKERREHYGQLTEQLRAVASSHRELHSETRTLVQALRAPNVRGRWGEIQLQRVVEMAGMVEHCDFDRQRTVEGESRARPDLVVRLPGGKQVVVDAKAPLEAYLAAVESGDPAERARLLGEHARHVRDHMSRLGSKRYQDQFEDAPEFVVMFLPGETFFSAALEQDPALIEFGVAQKVIPASPTTLIALLRAVAYGWQQERVAQNAREISRLGRELHGRIAKLAGHFGRVGNGLERAVQAYNEAVGSLETRVLVQTRRFRELGAARSSDEIPEPARVDRAPRALQATELQDSDPPALSDGAADRPN